MNRFDALGHRYAYGEGPTLDLKLLAAAIKQANRDQKSEKELEKVKGSVVSRTNRRAVDAALAPQRAAMERVERALAANAGWGVDPPSCARGCGAMGGGEPVAQFVKRNRLAEVIVAAGEMEAAVERMTRHSIFQLNHHV